MADITTMSVRQNGDIVVGVVIDDLVRYLNEGISLLESKPDAEQSISILSGLITNLNKLKETHLNTPDSDLNH